MFVQFICFFLGGGARGGGEQGVCQFFKVLTVEQNVSLKLLWIVLSLCD